MVQSSKQRVLALQSPAGGPPDPAAGFVAKSEGHDSKPTFRKAAKNSTLTLLPSLYPREGDEDGAQRRELVSPDEALAGLTRQEQWERMELSADLLILLQWNRGDPRLSHWEEGFLTGMVRHIQTFHGAAKISPRQWDKIRLILEKLDAEPAETEEELELDA